MRDLTLATTLTAFFLVGFSVSARPGIPRENIPARLPVTVRGELHKLYSEDRSIRTAGAYRLAKWVNRYPSVRPYLAGMLHDSKPVAAWQLPDHPWAKITTSPGREAAKGLADGRATDVLLEALRTGKTRGARQNAAMALGMLGEKRAVPIMLQRIWNPGYHRALGRIGDPRAIGPMINELGTNRAPEAAAGLRIMGPRAVPALTRALESENHRTRSWAADILGRLKAQEAGGALLAAAREGSLEAAEALLRLDHLEGAEEVFRHKLGHADWRWRKTALAGLIHLKAEVPAQSIIKRLSDADNTVRGYAARATAALDVQSARDELGGLLDDESDFARQEATEALALLGDERALPAIRRILQNGNVREKRRAAGWLRRIGTVASLRLLAGLLGEPEIRETAARELRSAGPEAISAIKHWLVELDTNEGISGKEKWDLASRGCGLLAHYNEAAIPTLIELLDRGWRIQIQAQLALREITGKKFEGGWQKRTPEWKKWWQKRQNKDEE